MHCFSCHHEHVLRTGERVGFRDSCACGADLHVCRNCAHHDPHAHNECRESSAERVGDRERANRCDWFSPLTGAPTAKANVAASGKAALENLFKKRP